MHRFARLFAAPMFLAAFAVAVPMSLDPASPTLVAPAAAADASRAGADADVREDDGSWHQDRDREGERTGDDDRCIAGASSTQYNPARGDRSGETSDCRLVGDSEDDADWDGLRMASGRPVNGWWWDPAQAGRGYSIEIHDGRLFLGAFLYDQTGRAMWVVSTGRMSDPLHYTGQLVLHGGGPTLEESRRAPQPLGDLGTVRLTFTGPGAGSLTMPDGSVAALERFSVVAGGATRSWDGHDDGHPTTGWYWNPAQGGRGFFTEVQGDRLFVVAFMYRSDGSAVWYAANEGLVSGGAFQRTFTGSLYEYQSSPGLGTSVEPSREIGTATVQFRRGGRATVTMPTGETIAVQRFRF